MKLCDRCRVSGCLLTYGGKACREARKQECPDVVFTRADKIREMDDEELAVVIMCRTTGTRTAVRGRRMHRRASSAVWNGSGNRRRCCDGRESNLFMRGPRAQYLELPGVRYIETFEADGRWKTAGTSALAAAMRSRWRRSARVPSTTGTVCASFARLSATTV